MNSGYCGWQDHEYRALAEFAAATGTRLEYLAYGTTWVRARVQ